MLKTLFVLFVILCGTGSVSATTISVTVSGGSRSITFNWEFTSGGGDCIKGQFANGDWWVAPAAGQDAVTLTTLTGQGSGQIYCDENPEIESMGILSKDYGNQDTGENIIPQLPQVYNYTTSLVAGIQRDENAHGNCGTSAIVGACIDAYCVITVLDEVPVDNGTNMLRPNITRAEKELLTWDDFDLTRMPSLDYMFGTDAAGLENIRNIWSHHVEILSMRDIDGNGYSEGGRAFRADLVTDDYAASVARSWHTHMMVMFSDDHAFDQKKAALAAMLTYGKDIFYNVYDVDGTRERWFGTGAGQSIGRFPPAVFFAAVSKDPLYGNSLRQASTTMVGLGGDGVHELEQVNIGHNAPIWGDGGVFTNQYEVGGYWGEMLNNQQFEGASGNFPSKYGGNKASRDPYNYIDGPGVGPGGAYCAVTGGGITGLAAEMYLMDDICDIVNYDAIIQYSNRLFDVGKWASPDPCAPPDPREDPATCDAYRTNGCKYYGLSNTGTATWGPDPDSVAVGNWSACIKNGTDPVTGNPQNGRYTSKHGENIDFSAYAAIQVTGRWRYITLGRDKSTCKRDVAVTDVPVNEVLEAGVTGMTALSVSPSPSTGFIRVTGPSGTYRVYDRNGTFVKVIGVFGVLDAGVYVVAAPDGSGMTKVIITK